MRAKRERDKARKAAEVGDEDASKAPKSGTILAEKGRLVLVPVWIPRTDRPVIDKTAERLRRAARIPDDPD